MRRTPEQIIEDIEIWMLSCQWLIKEANKLFSKIKTSDENDFSDVQKYKNIISKAKIELRISNKLKKELDQIFEE